MTKLKTILRHAASRQPVRALDRLIRDGVMTETVTFGVNAKALRKLTAGATQEEARDVRDFIRCVIDA